MSKYVLIPDSFKGSLSSGDICRIAAEEILRLEPSAEICAIPVADGGEGTVDAFLAAVGGRRIAVSCAGPYGEPMTAYYGLLPDGTAVVEMAAAAGLPLVGDARDPEKTTTYGVGQLMVHALSHGAKRLVLGLGGSATNDGGFGAGAAAFFGGTLRMGIDTVLDTADFDRRCRGARLVITGEGHLDSQSLRGKTVIGVARRAKALGVPVAALVGGCETALDAVYEAGVSGVFPVNPVPCTLAEAQQHGEAHLRFTVGNLLRFMAALEK